METCDPSNRGLNNWGYLLRIPHSPATTMASTHIIDDSDLQIQYSVGWRSGGRNDEFNTTTTLTSTANASFTLNFVGEPNSSHY